MNAEKFTTPCGFEIFLIPIASMGALQLRVFFGPDEIELSRMNGRMSRDGWLMLADKIKHFYFGQAI